MTHLTEGAQYAWLKELRRILRPGGLCLLSTHGEYAFLRLDESRVIVKSCGSPHMIQAASRGAASFV
jgi:hypothetical protein